MSQWLNTIRLHDRIWNDRQIPFERRLRLCGKLHRKSVHTMILEMDKLRGEVMNNREIDVLVAEKVFGWRDINWYENERGRHPQSKNMLIDRYTTNASDDYKVLCKVRETWNNEQQADFGSALETIWQERNACHFGLDYQPGDYSRAALAALGVEVEEEHYTAKIDQQGRGTDG